MQDWARDLGRLVEAGDGSPVVTLPGYPSAAITATTAASLALQCVVRSASGPVPRQQNSTVDSGVEEASQDHLRLRVTESGIELHDAQTARGQRQSGVEQSGEGRSRRTHLVDGRLQHPREDLLDESSGAHGSGE